MPVRNKKGSKTRTPSKGTTTPSKRTTTKKITVTVPAQTIEVPVQQTIVETPIQQQAPIQQPVVETPVQQTPPVEKVSAASQTPSGEKMQTNSVANSFMDDLLVATDKDGKVNEVNEDDPEDEEEEEGGDEPGQQNTTDNPDQKKNVATKVVDALIDKNVPLKEISNADRMRKANATATLYTETYALALQTTGQVISGDWSVENEARYAISEERKKNIIEPWADLLYIKSKTGEPASPGAGLAGAMIMSVIPVVVNAFRDRKNKKLLAEKDKIIADQKVLITDLTQKVDKLTGLVEQMMKGKTFSDAVIESETFNKTPVQKRSTNSINAKVIKMPTKFGVHKVGCTCGRPSCVQKLKDAKALSEQSK